ncbi:MAG: restriction endonuclease subunit S [Psychrobacter sp.]
MAKFKAYEKYVYSDYFKTELPLEWAEKRLSYISAYDKNSFVDGPFGSDLKSDDYKDSGVPLIQLNNIRDGKHVLQNYKFITEKKRTELSRHVALPNDIVIAKMAEPVARSAIVSNQYPEYVIVADCVKLSPDLSLINLSFLNWAINSELVKRNAELVSSGTTRIRVSLGELKKLKIPYPNLIEQAQIANFLDHETAQIDTLIDKQQTLIQLLKEKRQAVISHAVTKGLNPDAPMKDSGVEWLGEVPEHWEITKAKYISKVFIPQRNKPELNDIEGCPWVTMEDMKAKYIDQVHRYVRSESMKNSGSKVLKAGAVIASCVGNFGVTSINRVDVIINQQLQAFQPKGIKPEYLQSIVALSKSYFELIGTAATLIYVNREGFENLPVIVPTTQEQETISEFIDMKSKQFDLLVSKAEQAIQLMQERRTALISAAVTGKIDVRGWQAPDSEAV